MILEVRGKGKPAISYSWMLTADIRAVMLSESVVDRMVAVDGGSEGDNEDWPVLVAHNGLAVGSIVTGGAAGCRDTKHRVQAAGDTTCAGARAGGKIGTRSIGSSGITGRAAWVVVFNAGAKASFSIAF